MRKNIQPAADGLLRTAGKGRGGSLDSEEKSPTLREKTVFALLQGIRLYNLTKGG